jgi:hypothetical protein
MLRRSPVATYNYRWRPRGSLMQAYGQVTMQRVYTSRVYRRDVAVLLHQFQLPRIALVTLPFPLSQYQQPQNGTAVKESTQGFKLVYRVTGEVKTYPVERSENTGD